MTLLAAALVAWAAAAQDKPSIAVILTDHHFRLTAPAQAGPLVWRVRNEGTEPHQALVVRLPDRVSESAERAWIDHGSKGSEPGERVAAWNRSRPARTRRSRPS